MPCLLTSQKWLGDFRKYFQDPSREPFPVSLNGVFLLSFKPLPHKASQGPTIRLNLKKNISNLQNPANPDKKTRASCSVILATALAVFHPYHWKCRGLEIRCNRDTWQFELLGGWSTQIKKCVSQMRICPKVGGDPTNRSSKPPQSED